MIRVERRYRQGTLILETDLHTADGLVRITDCMPPRGEAPDVVRTVECLSGRVPMRMELRIRFDYGSIIPWVRRPGRGIAAVAGPDSLCLHSDVPTRGEDLATVADFTLSAGESASFVMTWHPSHEPSPRPVDAGRAITDAQRWWRQWTARCTYRGDWSEAVVRSLITLKALAYAPTGAIMAAPTTSLPEQIGGARNWDHRCSWLRDATLALYALLFAGYRTEARDWRDWLAEGGGRRPAPAPDPLRAGRRAPADRVRAAGCPASPTRGRCGSATTPSTSASWTSTARRSTRQARRLGVPPKPAAWSWSGRCWTTSSRTGAIPTRACGRCAASRARFTHSKVMAWVAMDRAVSAVEDFGLQGPVERWRRLRAEIHAEVCERAYDPDRLTFTRSYDSHSLDAGQLLIPSTVWLVDCLALQGRADDARALFERLLALRNDVGLLSEEYDTRAGVMLGNFPQAFSHVGLVNAARNLSAGEGPADHRRRRRES